MKAANPEQGRDMLLWSGGPWEDSIRGASELILRIGQDSRDGMGRGSCAKRSTEVEKFGLHLEPEVGAKHWVRIPTVMSSREHLLTLRQIGT